MKEMHDETHLRPTLPDDDERASVLLCSAYLHRQVNYPLPAHVGKESSEVHLPFILFADVREVEKLVPSLIILDLKVGSDNQGMLRRSEEHTSELQSRQYLVCRLLLEKKIPASH